MTAQPNLAPLPKAKVDVRVAEYERDIEVKRELWNQLQQLADDAYRELLTEEARLAGFRSLVAERGVTEEESKP